MTFDELQGSVPDCTACPRLARYVRESREAFPEGWCRPVPGFGDRKARLVVLGLAPGLKGAHRTGRPFTGDAAGAWLYAALHEAGVAERGRCRSAEEDPGLDGVWITNVVKCVPPKNRPKGPEFRTCRKLWLGSELDLLEKARVLLALGGDAHREALKLMNARPLKDHPFTHGAVHRPEGGQFILVDSYHPSRQNTNTGRLSREEFLETVDRAASLAGLTG